MDVLFLTPAFPPFIGGGERYVSALAHQLLKRGHRVTVVTSAAKTEQDFWHRVEDHSSVIGDGDAFRVIRCSLTGLPGGRTGLHAWRKAMVAFSALPGDQSRILMAMARLIPPIAQLETTLNRLPQEFDIIHAFNISWEYPIIAAWRFAQHRGTPLIVEPFTHLGVTGSDRVARNSTMDHQIRLMRDANYVLTLTDIETDELRQLGIDTERVNTVGSGIERLPSFPNPDLVRGQYDLHNPYAIFVGRVSHDKGAIDAAKAIIMLRDQGELIDLCLVGQTTPEFERFISQLPDDDRHFIHPLGLLSEENKHALLDASSMLVLPSRTDSLGIVLLEAWSHGKPVIGARAGGIPGVIEDGHNGLLIEYGDVPGLAGAIRTLLNDPALSDKMGQYGRHTLDNRFNWDRVADLVLDSYQRALIK